MNTLIERLEALTAPCREVDALIELAVGENGPAIQKLMDGSPHNTIDEIAKAADRDAGRMFYHIATYTASIDAAMTLVDGWAFPHMEYVFNEGWVCQMQNSIGIPFKHYRGVSRADHPYGFVLALCIAALKARDAT